MATTKLTQAEFLEKSKFKVFVPEDEALGLSSTAFHSYLEKLIKGQAKTHDGHPQKHIGK